MKVFPRLESGALADSDDPADSTARLEQALERIAEWSARMAPQGTPLAADTAAEAAARLDILIARLRTMLDYPPEG
jgi:hypothetical protein